MFIKSSLRPIAGKVSIFVSAALTFGLIGSSVPASAVPVSGSITYSTAGSTQVWTVPSGVTQVTAVVTGGGGGNGGNDSGVGAPGVSGGQVTVVLSVTPGQTITAYPGGAGGAGGNANTCTGGGSGGASGYPGSIYKGGLGGRAGCSGSSGGGGGGGAASVLDVSGNLIIAGGGGGGGGGRNYYDLGNASRYAAMSGQRNGGRSGTAGGPGENPTPDGGGPAGGGGGASGGLGGLSVNDGLGELLASGGVSGTSSASAFPGAVIANAATKSTGSITLTWNGAVPGAPTGVTAVATNAQAAVSWTAPTDNGGYDLTGYTVTSTPGSFTCATTQLTCSVTGLTNGTSYTFAVVANNQLGSSASSTATSAVTPSTVPAPPQNAYATRGNTQATVKWIAPTTNGGAVITSYTATSSPEGKTCTTAALTCVVTGLTNGTIYTFTITATNSRGTSEPSLVASEAIAPSIQAATVATSPTGVSATPGNASAIVTWSAPTSNGGAGISGYTITAAPGGRTCTWTTGPLTCTVTTLTNGTSYTFTAVATNIVGNSSASQASSAVTPFTVPNAPTSVTGVRGNSQVQVSWTAPGNNGGSPITGYTITSTPESKSCTWTSGPLTCLVSDLTNGTSYVFTAVATNLAGNSVASANSPAYIPATVPAPPTDVSVDRTNTQAIVTWAAPTNTGGLSISGYTITSSPGDKTCTWTSGPLVCTVTGLTNGTSYTFTAKATNVIGTSLPSDTSVPATPGLFPSKPIGVTGVRGNQQVTVSWTAPANNGGTAVNKYVVTSSPEAKTCTTNGALNCIVTGLTNGTPYTFTVVATNVATSESNPSAASAAFVPATVPGAPQTPAATSIVGAARVTWSAPLSDGGTAVTGYTVTSTPGSKTCTTTTALTCDVTGLTGNTAYTFAVVATNAAGNSVASSASSSITFIGAPTAPTSVSAVKGNTQATVSWSTPTSLGGGTITGYTVTSNPGAKTCTWISGPLTCVVTDLTNGTPYTFSVVANATGGNSTAGNSGSVTPSTLPNAPTAFSSVVGDGWISISWRAPVDNGGSAITGYTVTSSPSGRSCSPNAATLTCYFSPTTNGTAYVFSVLAVNANGSSTALVSDSVTSSKVPGAPTSVTAVRGNAQATVSWTAPASNGGAPITSYTVTSNQGSKTCIWTTGPLSCDVTGLTNGTSYTFTVVAENAAGPSVNSAASSAVVPATVPNPPTALSATGGNGQATVTWTAPVSNGGSAITSYTVTSSPEGKTCTWTAGALSCIVTGLTNGTAYTFTATATNVLGVSLTASAASAAVTPATVPSAPSSLTVEPTNTVVVVTWTAPVSTGGAAITGYTVTSSPGARTCTTSGALTCAVTNLTNGTAYTFTAVATNRVGNSVASAQSPSTTPLTSPTRPTAVVATAGVGVMDVSWTAPAYSGASSIASYTVTASPGEATCVTATTTCQISTLTPRQSYTFTVVAKNNLNGFSGSSVPSAAVLQAGVSDAPTAVAAITRDKEAVVSWTAPANDGGSAITGYTVTSSPEAKTCTTDVGISIDANSCLVTGLTNGTAYTFTVVAINAQGNSVSSEASASVTPSEPTFTYVSDGNGIIAITGCTGCSASVVIPSQINGFTVTRIGGNAFYDQSITSVVIPDTVTTIDDWAFGKNSLTSVEIPASVTSIAKSAFESNALESVTFLGDAPSSNIYSFHDNPLLAQINVPFGATGFSETYLGVPVVRFTTVPDAPTGVSATIDNGQALVSWTAPANNGGAAITGYTVTSSPEGKTCSWTTGALNCTITGLTNGTAYTFTVIATNSRGNSISSQTSDEVTPATVADAPTAVSGTVANGESVISWTAPSNTGGAAITSYTVTSSPEGKTCSTFIGISQDVNSCTITGLTNGTSYTFTVVATNSRGDSISSQTSDAVIPTIFTYTTDTNNNVTITGCISTCPEVLVIPATIGGNPVTNIGVQAFVHTTVTSVTIPNSVITIEAYAFASAELTSLSIPASVTTLGDGAFTGNKLTSITIPSTVRNIGAGVFQLNELTSATFLGDAPTIENGYVFDGNPDLPFIVVPVGASGWGQFYSNTPVYDTNSIPTVPDPPTGVVGVSGPEQVTVSWVAPANTGGASIRSYTVRSIPAGGTCSTDGALSCTITGLTKGSTYTFAVAATNLIGISAKSSPSSTVTVNGRNQAISITQVSDRTWSNQVVTVSVSSNDVDTELGTDLAVTLASTTSTICTVDGSDVTTLRPGTCTLRATQAGNDDYEAATPVTMSFQVLKASQVPLQVAVNSVTRNGATITPVTLTLANAISPSAANVFQVLSIDSGGSLSVNLQSLQPISSSTAPTFRVAPSDAGICAVSAQGLVTISDLGNCRVQVQAPANDYYLASGQQGPSDPVGVVTVWINTVAHDPNGGGPKPPVDTGESAVDNSFKSPGDTDPALVVTTDPTVASTMNFGGGASMSYSPTGKITPIFMSKFVGSFTYVMSFTDKSKSFSVMGCPLNQYKDKAKKICKAPKLVPSATCTLTSVKKMTGKEFTKMQPFKFGSCQINAAGLAKLKDKNVAKRPKVAMRADFRPVWPVNGKVRAKSQKTGKFYTAVPRKGTRVMKFG